MLHHRLLLPVALAAAMVFALAPAGAQQSSGQGWFIPGQSRQAAPRAAAPRQSAAPAAMVPQEAAPPEETPPTPPEQLQVQLPPAPPVPDVPHGAMPPAAVIGVLSIPDVLRASTAYQAADKTIGERRQKLNDDAQKEQTKLRDMGQQLASERGKLSAEQARAHEKELQDRFAESRRTFTERNRIIQEQGQYALLQIQRTLTEVVQKVASSRGMNLVLQRAEIAVNIPEFDITPQVTEVLNKALPSVVLPAEGVSPVSSTPVASNADQGKADQTKADQTKKAAATAAKKP